MRILLRIVCLFMLYFLCASRLFAQEKAMHSLCHDADKIFTNATFITENPKQPRASAVAVIQDRIVAVGKKATLLNLCQGKHTKIINLKNAYVTPGFIDLYSKLVLSGWLTNHALDLSAINASQKNTEKTIKTTDDVLAVMHAQDIPKNQWTIVSGYDENRLKGEPLNAEMLDMISTNSPIIVINAIGDRAYLNHTAIKKIKKKARKQLITIEPSGVIKGPSFDWLLATFINEKEAMKSIITAANKYAQQGYTTITEVQGSNSWVKAYNTLTSRNKLPVDVIYNARSISNKKRLNWLAKDNPRLYSGPLLIQMDGQIQHSSAFLSTPYQNNATKSAHWQGSLLHSPKTIANTMKNAYKEKINVIIESHGDAATDLALNIIQTLQIREGAPINPILINMQYLRADQLKRLQSMNLKTIWDASYLADWTEVVCPKLFVTKHTKNLHSTPSNGDELTINSIHPGEANALSMSLKTMKALHHPPVKQNSSSKQEKACDAYFTLIESNNKDELLKLFTSNAAQMYGLDEDKGTIAVGKIADMTLFSSNPLTSDFKAMTILGTVSRGQLHWNKDVMDKSLDKSPKPLKPLN